MRLPQFIPLLISFTISTSADPWPVKLLESLRGDKKIDQGGYDRLVKHGRDVIQGRDRDFKLSSFLLDDFIALFSPKPFRSRLREAVTTLVSFSCASAESSKYVQGKLVEQGVLSESQNCKKGPLIIHDSKCPIDGTPFEPIRLERFRADTRERGLSPQLLLEELEIKYPRLFLEDCVYSKNIAQIVLDVERVPIAEILIGKILKENESPRKSKRISRSVFADETAKAIASKFNDRFQLQTRVS